MASPTLNLAPMHPEHAEVLRRAAAAGARGAGVLLLGDAWTEEWTRRGRAEGTLAQPADLLRWLQELFGQPFECLRAGAASPGVPDPLAMLAPSGRRFQVVVALGLSPLMPDMDRYFWNLHQLCAEGGTVVHMAAGGRYHQALSEVTFLALERFAERNGYRIHEALEFRAGPRGHWSPLEAGHDQRPLSGLHRARQQALQALTPSDPLLVRCAVLRKERHGGYSPLVDPGQELDNTIAAAELLKREVNRNGGPLYAVLSNWRGCEETMRLCGLRPAGTRVLELGGSSVPYLPLAGLLHGVARFVTNNVVPVMDEVPLSGAEVTALLVASRPADGQRSLREVGELVERPWGAAFRLRPERFASFAPMGAEELPDEAGPADFVYSVAVFEHVRQVAAAARRSFQLTAPGGYGVHFIDLRDHRDFSRPLDFLAMTAEEWQAESGGSENRLRHHEHERIFRDAGFEIVLSRLMDRPPGLAEGGNTDVTGNLVSGLEDTYHATCEAEVRPWVTEAMRAGFAEPFRSMSLQSLSVLGQCLVVRRPAERRG